MALRQERDELRNALANARIIAGGWNDPNLALNPNPGPGPSNSETVNALKSVLDSLHAQERTSAGQIKALELRVKDLLTLVDGGSGGGSGGGGGGAGGRT